MIRRIILFLVTLFLIVGFSSSTSAKFLMPKKPNADPVPKVNVNLHISNLQAIDTTNESWTFTGYIIYDFPIKCTQGNYDIETEWHPAIEVVNVSTREDIGVTGECKGDHAFIAEKVKLTAASNFNIKRFPFDNQRLVLALESGVDPHVRMKGSQFTIGKDRFVGLEEWRILKTSIVDSMEYFLPETIYYSRVTFALDVQRNSQFFQQKILIPIFAITLTSLIILFLDTRVDFSTQVGSLLSTAFSSLTLWLLSAAIIPRAIDPSILDLFIRNSLAYNILALLVVVALQVMYKHEAKINGVLSMDSEMHWIVVITTARFVTLISYLISSGVILFL